MAFVGATLLTTQTVLLLPLFFFLSLTSTQAADGSAEFSWRKPTFLLLTSAFGLGVLLREIIPAEETAGFAFILQPLLGPRWLANSIYLLTVFLLVSLLRPWQPIPLHRVSWLDSPRGILLVLVGYIGFLWALYQFQVAGTEIFAQTLLVLGGLLLALAALFFAVASTALSATIWALVFCLSLAGSWLVTHPGQEYFSGKDSPALEPLWESLKADELLLIPGKDLVPSAIGVPLELAARGQIRTYASATGLKAILKGQGVAQTGESILILAPAESQESWLQPVRSEKGSASLSGKGKTPWVLHKFHPEFWPRPVVVFSSLIRGANQGTQGLYPDGIWTTQAFSLVFNFPSHQAKFVDLTLRGWRKEKAGPLVPGLIMELNGRRLELQKGEKTFFRYQIPPGLLKVQGNTLQIRTSTFAPHDLDPNNSDRRELGLDLQEIILR